MAREYSKEFYDFMAGQQTHNATSALNALKKFYQPKSAVDVGCGIGGWIKAAKFLFNLPDDDLLGLDGPYVQTEQLLIPETQFRRANLDEPFSFQRRFDLAICCEVAEHVAPERADSFVGDLTAASDVVLFSAAMPFQGGTHHVNEQWPEYWGILFRARGFVAYDVIRDIVWNDENLDWYYRQNLLVFARPAIGDGLFGAANAVIDKPLTRIHPYMFMTMLAKYWPNMYGISFGIECDHWSTLTTAYITGAVSIPSTLMSPDVKVESWSELRREHLEAFRQNIPNNSRIYLENPIAIKDGKLERG
jgi:hypothetical protein